MPCPYLLKDKSLPASLCQREEVRCSFFFEESFQDYGLGHGSSYGIVRGAQNARQAIGTVCPTILSTGTWMVTMENIDFTSHYELSYVCSSCRSYDTVGKAQQMSGKARAVQKLIYSPFSPWKFREATPPLGTDWNATQGLLLDPVGGVRAGHVMKRGLRSDDPLEAPR
jgi:hypothetical protein